MSVMCNGPGRGGCDGQWSPTSEGRINSGAMEVLSGESPLPRRGFDRGAEFSGGFSVRCGPFPCWSGHVKPHRRSPTGIRGWFRPCRFEARCVHAGLGDDVDVAAVSHDVFLSFPCDFSVTVWTVGCKRKRRQSIIGDHMTRGTESLDTVLFS